MLEPDARFVEGEGEGRESAGPQGIRSRLKLPHEALLPPDVDVSK